MAEVVQEPHFSGSSKQALLRPVECRGNCPTTLVLGIFPGFSEIGMADRVSLQCSLHRPGSAFSDFDFSMVLAKDGAGYECRYPKNVRIVGRSKDIFLRSIRLVQDFFEEGVDRAIPSPESGLVSGLLVGGSGRMPPEIQNNFSRAGVSHIVAVSGYNVALVVVLISSVCVLAGFSRTASFWLSVFALGFFTAVVGFPASAVRASVMTGAALLSVRFGRIPDPINAILLAGSSMVILNPLLLQYDIGFQLSFAATIGIFSFAPFLLLSFSFSDILATTLAAEFFTFPIVLFHFHALPVLSTVANLLVLPLVPIAMFLGFTSAVTGTFLPDFAEALGFPAFLVSRSILWIVRWCAESEFSTIALPFFGVKSLLASLVIISTTFFFLRKKSSILKNI